MSEPACHLCANSLTELWGSAVDVEYGSTDDRFRYFLCRSCEALSIDPLPEGRLAEIYPSTYYAFAEGEDAFGQRHPVARVKRVLDRRRFGRALDLIGRSDPNILDVGGGTGAVAASLLETDGHASAQATVVDIDPPSIDAARNRGLGGAVSRFEDFETEERFDLILMLNLIEHVAHPVEMLSKAHRLLARDGLVWIQTPNFRSLDARLFRHRNWTGLHCPRHWVIFSVTGLRRALSAAGLEPVSVERTQGGSFWASSVLGLRRRPPWHGDLPRPLVQCRSFLPLAGAGAAFDFGTRSFRQTSQVAVLARPASG